MSKGRWKRQTKTGLKAKLQQARARVRQLEAVLASVYETTREAMNGANVIHVVRVPKPRLTLPPELNVPATPVPETPPVELSDGDNLGEGRWV